MAVEIPTPRMIETEPYTDALEVHRWHKPPEGCDPRRDFLCITIPSRDTVSSIVLPGAENNQDNTLYVQGQVPSQTRLSLDHRAIYFEKPLPADIVLSGREKNVISAPGFTPGAKVKNGALVVLGKSGHTMPNEKHIATLADYGVPVIIVPEEKRMEVFTRLAGMMPNWREHEQKYLDSLTDHDFDIISGEDAIKACGTNINEVLARLKQDGILSAVFPNGFQLDPSLFPSRER